MKVQLSLIGMILYFVPALSVHQEFMKEQSYPLQLANTLSNLNQHQQSNFLIFTPNRMLNLAVNYGKTFIITNAADGWVQYSA